MLADVIVRSHNAREIIKETLAILRDRGEERVNLPVFLRGARFQYHFQGILAPTRCPNTSYKGQCGWEESFDQMLRCYSSNNGIARGPEAIEIMAIMPRRTLPLGKRSTRPILRTLLSAPAVLTATTG